MKKLLALTIILLLQYEMKAQTIQLPLWPSGKVPNYRKTSEKENWDTADIIKVTLVQTPDIMVYLPSKRTSTGQAIVICPGGGYGMLAYDWEGIDPARWLASKGIAAIVLKYRLPISKSNIDPRLSPLMDAQRAIRLVRLHAKEWNIKEDHVGIMGFSAGGHLASTAGTHFDYGDSTAADPIERKSARPDFMVLVYPVISMTKSIMHAGSRNNLIGEHPDSARAAYYSSELQVSKQTPPTFLVHATDDQLVPVENSLLFYQALKDHGISAELHVFPKGGHGFGLAVGRGTAESWTDLCISWLHGK